MKVILIGLGGFGANLINDIKDKLDGKIDCAVLAKSDILENCELKYKIPLDDEILNEVDNLIVNYDKVLIVSGLGGNSSKRLVHIADHISRNKKDLKVIANKPFSWEGEDRNKKANFVIDELISKAIEIKIFDNNDIVNYAVQELSTSEAFKIHSDVIYKYLVGKN